MGGQFAKRRSNEKSVEIILVKCQNQQSSIKILLAVCMQFARIVEISLFRPNDFRHFVQNAIIL